LKEKVDSVVVGIANDPKLLSKFIKQLLNFDETIRDTFNYDGGNLELGWKGVTWEVLDTWFDSWLEAEKDFALQSSYFQSFLVP
jgi:RAD50-interacting protein 1